MQIIPLLPDHIRYDGLGLQRSALYVWLPVRLTDDGMRLEWLDNWDLSEFD